MGEVTQFTGLTRLDMPVERVLAGAAEAGFEAVLVIGMDKDGEPCLRSSKADGAEILWMLKLAEKRLLEVCAK